MLEIALFLLVSQRLTAAPAEGALKARPCVIGASQRTVQRQLALWLFMCRRGAQGWQGLLLNAAQAKLLTHR